MSGMACGEVVLQHPASHMIDYTVKYEPAYRGPSPILPITTGLWMWRQVMENCLGVRHAYNSYSEKDSCQWELPTFEEVF